MVIPRNRLAGARSYRWSYDNIRERTTRNESDNMSENMTVLLHLIARMHNGMSENSQNVSLMWSNETVDLLGKDTHYTKFQ